MAEQMTLLGWLYIADILDNPYGFNVDYDKNLEEVGFVPSGSLHKHQIRQEREREKIIRR